ELMRGRIGVMVELKTPARYRSHDVVARAVHLMSPDDVLVCFQRAALEEARSLRRGLRTVQHVGYGVSIRAAARGAWAAGFANNRVTKRGVATALRLRDDVADERVRRSSAVDTIDDDGLGTDEHEHSRAARTPTCRLDLQRDACMLDASLDDRAFEPVHRADELRHEGRRRRAVH